MGALPDYEFPLAVIDRTTDLRAVLQHIERLDDLPNTRAGIFDLIAGKVIEDTIEILADFRRQLNARHV